MLQVVNETHVENDKLFSTEDQGSRSVRNAGIRLSKYTESELKRQKTLRILAGTHDINPYPANVENMVSS